MSPTGQIAVTRIQRSPNVVSRVVAGEAIVVPVRRGAADMDSIYTFNNTGSMLWSLIENGGSAGDLAARLESEYGISPEQAAADTDQFVQELRDAGLIELT